MTSLTLSVKRTPTDQLGTGSILEQTQKSGTAPVKPATPPVQFPALPSSTPAPAQSVPAQQPAPVQPAPAPAPKK
jgi:hypothetical protein